MAEIHEFPQSSAVGPIERILSGVSVDRVIRIPEINEQALALRASSEEGVPDEEHEKNVSDQAGTTFDVKNGGIKEAAALRLEQDERRHEQISEERKRATDSLSKTEQHEIVNTGRFGKETRLSGFQFGHLGLLFGLVCGGVFIAITATANYFAASGISPSFIDESGGPSWRAYLIASLPFTGAVVLDIRYDQLTTDSDKRRLTTALYKIAVSCVGLWIASTAYLLSGVADAFVDSVVEGSEWLESVSPIIESLATLTQFVSHIGGEMMIAAIVVIYLKVEYDRRVEKIIRPNPHWVKINDQVTDLTEALNVVGGDAARLRSFIGSYEEAREQYVKASLSSYRLWKNRYAAEKHALSTSLFQRYQG